MAENHLEQLVSQWYEYKGFTVRRNARVGPRAKGGHEGELDVVAYEPKTSRLIHIETSMDADGWAERERRFSKKFQAGEKYARGLFHGPTADTVIEKIALFAIGSDRNHSTVGGGGVHFVGPFICELLVELRRTSWLKRAVPEQYSLIRTLQLVSHFRVSVRKALSEE